MKWRAYSSKSLVQVSHDWLIPVTLTVIKLNLALVVLSFKTDMCHTCTSCQWVCLWTPSMRCGGGVWRIPGCVRLAPLCGTEPGLHSSCLDSLCFAWLARCSVAPWAHDLCMQRTPAWLDTNWLNPWTGAEWGRRRRGGKTSQGPSQNLLMLIQSLQVLEKAEMSCLICAASFCVYKETERMECPGGSRAQRIQSSS